MARGRQKDPDSVSGRVRAFFEASPDEWLTYADMADKFGCTVDQAHKAVENLRHQGEPLQCATVVFRSEIA